MTLFQKIIDREIPAYIVYEDDYTLAFLDITQATPGHTLVIPKTATDSFMSADIETLAHVQATAQHVAKKLQVALNVNDFNIISNAGPLAGQTVFHYHVHIIPRYSKTDLKIEHNSHAEQIEAIFHQINKAA